MENMKIPAHLAIILDGNGRWAKKRNRERSYGHKVGFENIYKIALLSRDAGVKVLSVYCFSTENWSRPKGEVDYLMSLPLVFKKDINSYVKEDIKVIHSGRLDRIPKTTKDIFEESEEKTKDCKGLILNICFDYGSLDELKRGIEKIIENKVEDIKDDTIFSYLDTKNLPPVDLLIRCGGERRLSNFLLLQSAYAELYFIDVLWPDFSKEDLHEAFIEYNKRDRRYGGIKE
ncbi:MAG: di-trans,poly-cis-decaprenylcistransferase [Bacillales bacterium]|nr:di-trans,poly-cis-decaprenylcistransferase [Bacillales bacterium]